MVVVSLGLFKSLTSMKSLATLSKTTRVKITMTITAMFIHSINSSPILISMSKSQNIKMTMTKLVRMIVQKMSLKMKIVMF